MKKTKKPAKRKPRSRPSILCIALLVGGDEFYCVEGANVLDDLGPLTLEAATAIVNNKDAVSLAVEIDDQMSGTKMVYNLTMSAEAVRLAKQLVAVTKALQVVVGITRHRLAPAA